MEKEILFSRRERPGGAYAEIVLNRPSKGNALTMAMFDQLAEIVRQLEADRTVRAVVLRGAGRFFCTGGDVGAWGALTPERMADEWILRGIAVMESISALPQPVIAALHGHTLGGGLELALAADLRLALSTAKLGTPEVTIGMVAGWGGVRRLTEAIGLSRAQHLTLLGRSITASEALQWSLVTAVADTPEAFERSLESWLDQLLANAPIAMALTKRILAGAHTDARREHAAAVLQAAATADCAEGVAAFAAKRTPNFKNH